MNFFRGIVLTIVAALTTAAGAFGAFPPQQHADLLKPMQAPPVTFTKRVFMPVPGAESLVRDTAVAPARSKSAADSARDTRIVGVREGGDMFRLVLDVGEDQRNLSINVFNLLGKKVLEVYQGPEKAGKAKDFTLNVSSLPNGVYICVVQGDNFRLAEKFIISR